MTTTTEPINDLVALSGYARTGKDTVAQILVDNHGFTRVAFADKLREALYAFNPIVRVNDDDSVNFMYLQTLVDEVGWEEAKKFSPDVREYQQRLGTEVGRDVLGRDVWVIAALGGLDYSQGQRYVVTDCRFPNEADYIWTHGGILVRVERPGVGPANSHISEVGLDNHLFDLRLLNDGTVDDLAGDIAELIGVAI